MTRPDYRAPFDPAFASTADYANLYHEYGLTVVPALEPGEDAQWKRPLGKWKSYSRDGVPDALFAEWWGPKGKYLTRKNLGVLTGHVSNLIVVDLDTHKNPQAAQWWEGLLALHNNGMALETVTQRTGGGGRQLLFRTPGNGYHCPTGKTAIGVDIRGEGEFAVFPPSLHSSGQNYEWEEGRRPDEIPILTAPGWLCEAIDKLLEVPAGGDRLLKPNGHVSHETTASKGDRLTPPADYRSAIAGLHVDLRETYMRDLVWATIVGLYRDAPMQPTGAAAVMAFDKCYRTYLRHTKSRLAGPPEALEALLEREGRGKSALHEKWQAAWGQWDTGIKEAALVPDPRPNVASGAAKLPQIAEENGTSPAGAVSFTPYRWIDPAAIPPRQFIYGKHYIRQFVSTDISPGGVGKSSLAIADAVAMAAGRNLVGIQPPARLRVAYWNGEDPMEELQRRVQAVAQHYGLEPDDLQGLYVDTGRLMPIVLASEGRDGVTIAQPVVEAVIASLTANAIDVLVIDPFIASHRVTENDNNAIERVAKQWAQIADVTKTAINLVHHARKTNGAEVTVEDGRGAVALLAAARSARTLNQMSKEEANAFGIDNRRLYFRVDDGKANLSPPAEVAAWYRLVSVELANGPMGSVGDRVGAITQWTPGDTMAGMTSDDLKAVQNAVAKAKWRENPQASGWVGYCIAKTLGLNPSKAADRAKIKHCIREWLNSGALVVVPGLDSKRMTRDFVEVGTWVET